MVPVMISIACIVLVQVPAAYLLDAQLGLEGVWMAFPITYGAMLALQTAYYKLVWKHQKIERLV
jgi:Na+-driven multidrug efflux pump